MKKDRLLEISDILSRVDHSDDSVWNKDNTLKVSSFDFSKSELEEGFTDFKREVSVDLESLKSELDEAVEEAKEKLDKSQKVLRKAIQKRDEFITENVEEETTQSAITSYLNAQKPSEQKED